MSEIKRSEAVALEKVVTLAEIKARFYVSSSAIFYSRDRGYIRARKAGRVWLYLLADVEKRYGQPAKKPDAN